MSADLIITKLNLEINGVLSWENVLKVGTIMLYGPKFKKFIKIIV